MEFSWNPQCTLFLDPQVRTNKLVNCLPPMFFKISLKDTSFHISLNCLGFYLSRMFVQFSLTCVGKIFEFMVLTFLQHALKLCIFTHAPVPHSNSRYNFLKICTPQEVKGGENYDLLYQNLIRKYEFIFCMICNFFKCDAFTVLWLISIK